MEILKEIEYVLSHPNLSFFVGMAIAYFAVAVAEFGCYIINNLSSLKKKEKDEKEEDNGN